MTDPLPVEVTVDHTRNTGNTTTKAAIDEEALLTYGQRRINLIWEATQAAIALIVVGLTAVGMFYTRILDHEPNPTGAYPPEWWTIVGLVIGFYFSRTNHTKTGGTEQQRGR